MRFVTNRRKIGRLVYCHLFALRSVPHESTGFTPAELVYGRSLRSPLRMLREAWEGRGEDHTVVDYVLKLLNRLQSCKELVEANMKNAQARAKLYYDKNARKRTFAVKDKVLLLNTSRKNKLQVQWEGPAEVVERLSDTNYVVKMPGRRKEVKIYHSNLMKPYKEREAVVQMALNIPEEVETDFEYPEQKHDNSFDKLLADIEENTHLSNQERQELIELVREFEGSFSDMPGKTALIEHDIELTSNGPIRSKPYRWSPRQKEILKSEIKRMLELGLIVEADSEYTSPIFLVEAPGKKPRPCIDYRQLNAVTRTKPTPSLT